MPPIKNPHDPDAVRTYAVYWGNNLADGDALFSASWTVPDGLTLVSQGTNAAAVTDACFTYPAGTLAEVRLSGGTDGSDYTLVCHIVTIAGDEDDQTVTIECREK
jgi:hypothetical protein